MDDMAFDPRQYDEHEELAEEEQRMKDVGDEAYEELMDYNRLTLGKA